MPSTGRAVFIAIGLLLAGCAGESGPPAVPTPVLNAPSNLQPKPIEASPATDSPATIAESPTQVASGPFPGELPVVWQGTFDEPDFGEHPVTLIVEQVQGDTFRGRLEWPAFDTVTAVVGEVVETFDEVEQWRHVSEFDPDTGVGLVFTETDYISGEDTLIGGWYFGHYRAGDGTMRGVWFPERDSSQPSGSFVITVQRPPQ